MKTTLLLGLAAVMASTALPVAKPFAQETTDPALRCGAFYIVMGARSEDANDKELFNGLGTLLLNEVDQRLAKVGVSGDERQRIGGEAVQQLAADLEANKIDLNFGECHQAFETAVESAMPGVVSKEARDLLICGSQFMHTLQTGEADEKTKSDLTTAANDQIGRASEKLTAAGVTAEELDQLAGYYGLSVGMVLGMGEEPTIDWETCGKV